MATETMTLDERRLEAAVILEGVLETVRMAHAHSELGPELGSILALIEHNLERVDDLVARIEVPSDGGGGGEALRLAVESDGGYRALTDDELRKVAAAIPKGSEVDPMTELEEALRIAHGTAIVLSGDNDLDECITGALEGIAAQLRRAKDAFEAIAKARASA